MSEDKASDLALLLAALLPGRRGPPGPPGPSGSPGSGLTPTGNDGYAAIELGGVVAMRPIFSTYVVPPFAIASFAPTGGNTLEVGASLATPGFAATYNFPPEVVTLTDSEGTPPKDVSATPGAFSSNGTFSKAGNNQTVVFTLSATDLDTGGTASATAVLAWRPRAYWGVGVTGGATEAFIEALASSGLLPSRATSFTVNPGIAEHIYFAYPDGYGAATFSVGGFPGGFVLNAIVPVTNSNGVTQNYRIYQSVQPNLGATTVTVA